MWDPSDEALLAGFGTGEPTAAAVFVRRFQSRVYGLAALIVGDGPAAADVAQEAFVRAWRHAEAYDPRRGSVTTWLLAITRNKAIDHLRGTRARPSEPLDLTAVDAAVVGSNPLDAAVVDDELGRVRIALGVLPDPQRRAVLLAAVGGRTAREIADIERIPLGTAKTRIRSGLRRVRDELKATGAPEEVDRG